MKILQKNLPKIIYEFLCQDFYDHEESKGTISATTLLRPIQEVVLTERHYDKIEVDAMDLLWALLGSGVHEVMAKFLQGRYKNEIESEQRLYYKILGITVSGKFDVVWNSVLHDFKITSAWSIVFNSRKEEWAKQLSIYRWLYFKDRGQELNRIAKIIGIFRDWTNKNFHVYNYPKFPIMEIALDLMTIDETEKFVKNRVKLLKESKKLTDINLPDCTDEERWYNKKQNKYNKCEKYCNAYKFCKQVNGDKVRELEFKWEGEPLRRINANREFK